MLNCTYNRRNDFTVTKYYSLVSVASVQYTYIMYIYTYNFQIFITFFSHSWEKGSSIIALYTQWNQIN